MKQNRFLRPSFINKSTDYCFVPIYKKHHSSPSLWRWSVWMWFVWESAVKNICVGLLFISRKWPNGRRSPKKREVYGFRWKITNIKERSLRWTPVGYVVTKRERLPTLEARGSWCWCASVNKRILIRVFRRKHHALAVGCAQTRPP